jgi:Ca2+-binding EF-hand superfamily protein
VSHVVPLMTVVFDTFDADDSGHLEEAEVCIMLTVINHERPLYPGNFQRMIQEFDTCV